MKGQQGLASSEPWGKSLPFPLSAAGGPRTSLANGSAGLISVSSQCPPVGRGAILVAPF